jgi:hypothetical protein
MSGAVTDHGVEHFDSSDPYKYVIVVHKDEDLLHLYDTAVTLLRSDNRITMIIMIDLKAYL